MILKLMRRIDELPTWTIPLPAAACGVTCCAAKASWRGVGMCARWCIACASRRSTASPTALRHPGHKVYPYLLRELTIDRANQVWAMDI